MNEKFEEYEVFVLGEDLGPEIKKGMRGVVLEVYGNGEAYEVEFVRPDGTNYLHEGDCTFSLDASLMRKERDT